MKKFLVSVLTLVFSTSAMASTFKVNTERSLSIVGEVGRQVVPMASRLDEMSRSSNDPIDIVINSPGGDVMAGLVFLSAMQLAKTRGVKIRCVTTLMSASMAFFFLANCSERYALPNAFLLWHPISVNYDGGQRSDTLIHDGNWMDGIEMLMIKDILPTMGISFVEYMYHRGHETMWTAKLLQQTAPKFLNIVDDVVGLDRPFLAPPQ